ncbi:SRPBCC family protein [Mycolicibacterium sp.]|uniref:SRPBCC family protein n=1 Tax=Mycolicibacterium sp. TaxID=2320850 RepID=UPI003D11C270
MKLVQDFDSPASPDEVFAALIDIERVTPCLPGAQVAEALGDGVYKGSFTARIGPTKTTMNGELRLFDVDRDAKRATLRAEGKDKGGQSKAQATIVFTVSPEGGASRVHVDTDYTIGGKLARFGRGELIENVANKILQDFSANLQELFAGEAGTAGSGASPAGGQTSVPPDAAAAQEFDRDTADGVTVTVPDSDDDGSLLRRRRFASQARPPRRAGRQSNLNIGAILLGILRDKIKKLLRRRRK